MRTEFTFCGKRCCAYTHNPFTKAENYQTAHKHIKLFGYALCVCDEKITGAVHPIEDLAMAELALVALTKQMERDKAEECAALYARHYGN